VTTSDDQCVLCGLDVGDRPCILETRGGSLNFCCEGCLGIYRLLNDDGEEADPAPGKADGDADSG